MNNELRMVAVYKDDKNYVSLVCGKLDEVTIDCQLYEAIGNKLEGCVITNNYETYLRTKLKARLVELREYSQRIEDYRQEHNVTNPVVQLTLQLMEEHEETLVGQVAVCVSSCILRDIEVTDELAIDCYNYRKSERI